MRSMGASLARRGALVVRSALTRRPGRRVLRRPTRPVEPGRRVSVVEPGVRA